MDYNSQENSVVTFVVMSVKIFSNLSNLKFLNKSGNCEEMPTLDYNRYNMESDDLFSSSLDDDASISKRSVEEVAMMPQFSIELGGGRPWWF